MTLRERIIYFERAATSEDDTRSDEELINALTVDELLDKISDAMEWAGIQFNTRW